MKRRKYIFPLILVFGLMLTMILIPGLTFAVREIALVLLVLAQVFVVRAGYCDGVISGKAVWMMLLVSVLLVLVIFLLTVFGNQITY